jgi:pimeloyl-ACP methyl ester carboxylesterase/quinol monooxygenase YgiN
MPSRFGENSGVSDLNTPASDGVIQLIVEVRARPDAVPALRAELEKLTDATHRCDDGVIRFEVAADPQDETRYVGYEIWASQGALDRHSAQPHTRGFLAAAQGLSADPRQPLAVSHWTPLRAETPVRYAPGRASAAQPPAGFAHQSMRTSDGAELHFVAGGAGRPVFLLHGFPSTWYAWRQVMTVLARQHRVIAVDLRGLGDSTAGTKPNDVPTDAEDLHELVAYLGYDEVAVLGQDWGGSAAAAYAIAYPGESSHLGVIEALPAGPWTDTTASGGQWFEGFHRVPELPETLIAGQEGPYLDWFYQSFSATPDTPSAEAVDEYLRTYAQPGKIASALGRYRGVPREIDHNAQRLDKPLGIPVLAVGGAAVFGDAVAANLTQVAGDVRGHVFAGCGHFVTEERPSEVSRLILDFLS